jgi:hypothetical protein
MRNSPEATVAESGNAFYFQDILPNHDSHGRPTRSEQMLDLAEGVLYHSPPVEAQGEFHS